MKNRVLVIVLIIAGFISVRIFGSKLFYDPLIDFFHHSDYSKLQLPEMNMWKYAGSLMLRFLANSILTMALVQVLFNSISLVKLTATILVGVFIILTPVLILLIVNSDSEQYRYLFYVRRILIHPVITLVLIPALFYNQRMEISKSKKE